MRPFGALANAPSASVEIMHIKANCGTGDEVTDDSSPSDGAVTFPFELGEGICEIG